MRKIAILLALVSLPFFQLYSLQPAFAGKCCLLKSCKCASGNCCEKAECKCAGQCCVNGQCTCAKLGCKVCGCKKS